MSTPIKNDFVSHVVGSYTMNESSFVILQKILFSLFNFHNDLLYRTEGVYCTLIRLCIEKLC
jgi:hypothetical protein